eukprot:945512-Amphidinium_carterae.1
MRIQLTICNDIGQDRGHCQSHSQATVWKKPRNPRMFWQTRHITTFMQLGCRLQTAILEGNFKMKENTHTVLLLETVLDWGTGTCLGGNGAAFWKPRIHPHLSPIP